MKRIILSMLFSLSFVSILPQKSLINVIRTPQAASTDWKILDDRYFAIFSSDDLKTDSSVFSLPSDNRYYLQISVPSSLQPDTVLYTLSADGETILNVRSDISTGDHLYPFYTGVKSDTLSKITGGANADISDFPWQVYLEINDFFCGGSIIDERWVITAGHCVVDDNNHLLPASSFMVRVGVNHPEIELEGKKYYVSEVFLHESFNPETLDNDLALLKITESIGYPNAEPVRIVSATDADNGATDPGVYSWVTGYGLTAVNPPTYATTLQKAQLPIVSNTQASVVWPEIPSSDLMAGFRSINRDACAGDSGGPLVVPFNNEFKLAGIVSWGSSKCNTYGAYTRLSLFENWITERTGIEISFRAPVPDGDSIICPGTTTVYQAGSVSGVTDWMWSLVPSEAGSVIDLNNTARINWNPAFSGKVKLKLQLARDNVLSETSELTITLALQTKILQEPSSVVSCAEKAVNLDIVSEGHNLKYEWYRNNVTVPEETSNIYHIANPATDDSGNYFCHISGSCGSILSGNISLTILPVTKIKSVTADTVIAFGADMLLYSSSEGHNLKYQWFKDDIAIDSETNPRLLSENANAGNIGLYHLIVTGTCGTQTSDDTYVYVERQETSRDEGIMVWPTVVDGILNVASDNDDEYNILIYNSSGKIIFEMHGTSYKTTVDMSHTAPGLYILTVFNADIRKSFKIIRK